MGRKRVSNCGFYDLNINVDGVQSSVLKGTVAMALQLGFSGIAQNHVVTGAMAHADTCNIRPFDVSVLMDSTPELADSVQFHRQLLGMPPSLPFRQYNRLTVVVDSAVQASALNASNPVLRSYDLVAVRPTNQKAFEQACSHLEVDIISLDLCRRLPFRLKPPTLKAAVERGVYFEITYSQAFSDLKARTEVFANAQMLQGMTRGHNIIISSGAQTLMDLRGPNDVANMATLFGLSREAAKAAVSTNCRAVILHGLARRKTYKGAIAIDYCPPDGIIGSHEALFDVPKVWDPLSNGSVCDFIPIKEKVDISSVFPSAMDDNPWEERNNKKDPRRHQNGKKQIGTKKQDKSLASIDWSKEKQGKSKGENFRKTSNSTQKKRKRRP